jgi:hypothetical protein
MTEGDFQEHLDWLIKETHAAMAVYDAGEELNRLAVDRGDIQKAIEADCPFWQLCRAGIQDTLFVILGRIFGKGKAVRSISKVMDAAEAHLEFFSAEALARRRTAGGPKPDWLDDYIARAWVPDKDTFSALKKSLEPHLKYYRGVYLPIRNNYIAHTSISPKQPISAMFQQTNRKELGEMITFLRDLAEAVRYAYTDGEPPILGNVLYESDRQEIRGAVSGVLEKLASVMGER